MAVEPGLHWGAEDIGLNVRLREFADFIEELPTGQFDMTWGEGTAMDATHISSEKYRSAGLPPALLGGPRCSTQATEDSGGAVQGCRTPPLPRWD